MFVCPVCKGRTITVYGQSDEAHSAKCNDCGTFDALHKFEAAVITTPGERDPLAIFPPDEIVAAARKLHTYFVHGREAKQWKFLNVQSSDAPAVVGIEHIRTMASAFQMELVTRPTSAALVDKVREAVNVAVSLPHPEEEMPSAAQMTDFQSAVIASMVEEWLFPVKLAPVKL